MYSLLGGEGEGLLKEEKSGSGRWIHGMVPLARNEIHEKMIDLIGKEPRGKLLDVPTGTGVLAHRLKEMGFDVSCCDINPSYFSAPDMEVIVGDLNWALPFPSGSFDYIACIEGLEHLENPFNAIREFSRILRKGGKVFLSVPNYLNIERRLRFLITGLFSKIPSPKTLGQERFENLWMLHLIPVTYPILKLILEHTGFEIIHIAKDKEKPRMKWLLPMVWGIRGYCALWPKTKRKEYHLNETLSNSIIMGGNTLIIVAEKRGE